MLTKSIQSQIDFGHKIDIFFININSVPYVPQHTFGLRPELLWVRLGDGINAMGKSLISK